MSLNPAPSELEAALRACLRRRPPARDLAPVVLARGRRPRPAPRRRWALALAAALLLVAGWAVLRRQADLRRQQQARTDAIQLARALRMAAADLNHIRAQVSP